MARFLVADKEKTRAKQHTTLISRLTISRRWDRPSSKKDCWVPHWISRQSNRLVGLYQDKDLLDDWTISWTVGWP